MTSKRQQTTHSLSTRPTFNPTFNSNSSHGVSNSGSSRQQSSNGQNPSSLGSDARSETYWPIPLEAQTSSVNGNNTITANSVILKRKTTQDLIGIFERQAPPSIAPPLASHSLHRGGRGKKTSINDPLPSLPKTNPLRESFRNLLTVFNKAKKTFGDHPVEWRGKQRSTSSVESQVPVKSHHSTASHDLRLPEPTKPTVSQLVPGLSSDIRSGVLLYYDNDPTSPAWHRCDAFLAPPNLRLNYFTPSGKSITRTVSVAGAMDARSIASTNCAVVAPPMLDGKPPHVFEVEFGKGVMEKFAAVSVLERGGWVSSIWDSILSTKARPLPQNLSDPAEQIFLSLPGPTPTTDMEIRNLSKGEENAASIRLDDVGTSTTLSVRTNTQSTSSNWSTTNASLTSSSSVRALEGMSIVKQRLARWDSPANGNTSNPMSAYATPPRTPAPIRRSTITSSVLSRGTSRDQTTSSAGCELASPRPIRAMVSSFLSSNDTGSSYGETSDIGVPQLDASEEPELPPVRSDFGLRALPQRPTPIKDDDFLPSVFTTTRQSGINHSLPRQSAPTSKFTGPGDVSKRGIDGLPKDSYDQKVELNSLDHQIDRMHRDIKLAIQQPALPIPQLDELRDRLEALASGLHGADLQGLHVKLDQLKDKSHDYTLHNVAPSSNDNVVSQLDVLTNTLNKLRLKMEDDAGSLPLIKDKLAAIQEHMEHGEAPPVPDKKELTFEANPIQEHLLEIQKKIDNLEAILVDLRKQGEEQRKAAAAVPVAEPPPSLSVFGNLRGPNNSAEPNQVPPEIIEILALVKEGQSERGTIATQFEDSVRYLNELNKWMEAFVAKTGGQEQLLQSIANAVCNAPQDSTMHNLAPNNQGTGASDATLEDLKTSMQTILRAIGDDMQQHTEFREAQGLSSVLVAIEKNQKDQETLLRCIAEGISADVRGERLRFVDAMKDATSVNVAIHLEEFKRQLSSEVMIMLQEVGRGARHRERNHLEKEIGEIFNQQVERRQSMGFQPLMQHPSRSVAPSRPHSEGPYPAFMMPPRAHSAVQPGQLAHPMPLHPNISGPQSRALPTPSGYSNSGPTPQPYSVHSSSGPTPQPQLNVSQMSQMAPPLPHRRRA